MDERTTGLILRTRPLTETSLIVHWLTPDLGRIATVAKGARRSNSPFRGKLDLFYLADFSFVRSRRSELHILREAKLIEPHAALRKEIHLLQQAAYCASLVEQTTETETPLPQMFTLFTGLLATLSRRPVQPLTMFAFELKLLKELGQSPEIKSSKLSGGTKQILHKLTELDWPALSRLKPSPQQSLEIRVFLHGFLIYHLGKIPAGRGPAVSGE